MNGHLYINGTWRPGKGEAFQSHAPATDDLLWEGRSASPEDVNEALAAAHSSFDAWRRKSVEERVALIRKYVARLTDAKEEMALAIARETGKPLWDARTEAGAMIGKLDISLKAYEERTGTKTGEAAGTEMRLAHRPHGIMVVIGPFNFPGHLPNGHIIPALIAGNTIIFKPSEMTPMVAEETVRHWDAAGLPPGVLNLVQGRPRCRRTAGRG